jgi:HEAT repeat protein
VDLSMSDVLANTVGQLIADAMIGTAGAGRRIATGSPQKKAAESERAAVATAVGLAIMQALSDADTGSDAPYERVEAVAEAWIAMFTPAVIEDLLECLAEDSLPAREVFVDRARDALAEGPGAAALGASFEVEEFLHQLPIHLNAGLRTTRDPQVRPLVAHLLGLRADTRASLPVQSSPKQLRADLRALLGFLQADARRGRLPVYLGKQDVLQVARTVRARPGVRRHHPDADQSQTDRQQPESRYQSPAERAGNERDRLPVPWPQVADQFPQIVVLADPGLGKSWLVRTETHRLATAALTVLDHLDLHPQQGFDLAALVVPVPVRCDQLVAAAGDTLAEAATDYLARQARLPAASRAGLVRLIENGQAVLLLDALDELPTTTQYQRLIRLLTGWTQQPGPRRWILTSRIAGYNGPPVPDAHEVELMTLTPQDVDAVIGAWDLPATAQARLRERVKDPAVAAMARVPLLLSLLCTLAADLRTGNQLPATRGALYGKALRRFLTRTHRGLDAINPEVLDGPAVEDLLHTLAPVAFHFATRRDPDDGRSLWLNLMPYTDLVDTLHRLGPPTDRRRVATDLVRDLTDRAGILVPAGAAADGQTPPRQFLHRTIAEYLVAQHLSTMPTQEWLDVIDEHLWFDPEWAEVIPLLGHHLPPNQARNLIEHLITQPHDPFHHALGTAIRILADREDRDTLLSAATAQYLAAAVTPRFASRTGATLTATLTSNTLPTALTHALLTRLDDEDPFVRAAVLRALAGSTDPRVHEGLLARLDDEIWFVRADAVRALAGSTDPRVHEGLLARLHDETLDVRAAAVRALAGSTDPRVHEGLLARLHDKDWAVRAAAAQALAGSTDPRVHEGLLARLHDKDWAVRAAAAQALAGSTDPRVHEDLLARLHDKDSSVRAAAAQALAGSTDPRVLEGLLACLHDKDWAVRAEAVRALAGSTDPRVHEGLLARLDHEIWFVRADAVRALAGSTDPRVHEGLLARLHDKNWAVRAAAAQALAGSTDPRVHEDLLARLHDKNLFGFVRAEAVQALAGSTDPRVLEGLLACLDDNLDVRVAAVRALARSTDPRVHEDLLARLHDKNLFGFVRAEAVQALARSTDPRVLEGFLACLDDKDSDVRAAAVRALAKSADPGALHAVVQLHESTSPVGQAQLFALLESLVRQHFLSVGVVERPALLARLGQITGEMERGS